MEEENIESGENTHSPGWDGNGDPFQFHRNAAIAALSEGVAAVYGYDVPGDIAEFGTMSGATAAGIARAIVSCDRALGYAAEAYSHPQRQLLLFDSFEGLPSVSEDSVDGQSPHVVDGVWSEGSLKGVSPSELGGMISRHLPQDRFKIYEGWFSNTVKDIESERQIALLHVDSDLYVSAMDVLSNLFSRGMIARGAYVYFDDWNCNGADPEKGERRAWSECVERFGIKYSDAGTYGIFAQRFIVHDYDGCPKEKLRKSASEEISSNTAVGVSETNSEVAEVPDTSTDVYDHQEASQYYHRTTGMSDMDEAFLPIYDRCREFSMTSPDRLYALYKAIEYIQSADIEGDIVECGVWRGGSMMVAAESLLHFGGRDRHLHLFDTFQGLPKPTDEDVDLWGNSADDWWEEKKTSEKSSDWARSNIEEVQENLARTNYPSDKLHFIKGLVQDTIPEHAPEKISLLRLDTDWYASTKHEMENLFPRLATNGILIIDDYGHFKGAKQAVDEYISRNNLPLMLMRIDYTGRIAIKTHG